ncbi:Mfa1 family fimbria major subunit [Porphyromonadaceae bacterium W3.11]|nr:Mfa1 family fimbria major subunit [Porphyromonadaceae bacterium W3.11]
MKRIFNLILASSVALGFAACNNDKAPQADNSTEGTTYAGMYISGEKSIAPRAISQTDEAGRDAEGKLETLYLLSTGGDKSWSYVDSEGTDGEFWPTITGSKIYKVAPWKTTAGNQIMALIINKGSVTLPAIALADSYTMGTAASAKDDIKNLSTDDAFVMTSVRAQKTIADKKDINIVKNGSTEGENVFKFDLERVVVQGKVAKGDDLKSDTKDGKGSIKLDDLTYAAVNGAVPTYLFANNAGKRTMGANGQYEDFKSAIDDYAEFQGAKEAANVMDKLIRLGNIDENSNDNLGGYAAIKVADDEDAAKLARGIYFLENSVKKDVFNPENKDFGFYRMAYAKVYATFTPKVLYTLNEDETKLIERTEEITVGMTFYKGADDGFLYDTKAAAKKNNTKYYTYKNGKCAYRALWNRQMDVTGKLVDNADVRRNNIYLLKITEFQGLGMPWDPSDPNDPNLPKPDGEDEGENPENPDIEESETYMRVEAEVIPWNLVTRDVNLK